MFWKILFEECDVDIEQIEAWCQINLDPAKDYAIERHPMYSKLILFNEENLNFFKLSFGGLSAKQRFLIRTFTDNDSPTGKLERF